LFKNIFIIARHIFYVSAVGETYNALFTRKENFIYKKIFTRKDRRVYTKMATKSKEKIRRK